MGLKKGQTNNPNGRPKGAQSEEKKELRKLIKSLAEKNFDEFQKRMDKIDKPELYCRVYIDMIKFVLPSLQSVMFDDVTDKKKSIEDKLSELSKDAGKE